MPRATRKTVLAPLAPKEPVAKVSQIKPKPTPTQQLRDLKAEHAKLETTCAELLTKLKSSRTEAKKVPDLEKKLATATRNNVNLTKAYDGRCEDVIRRNRRIFLAREALREIAEAGWPRLSRPLITRAQDALSELRQLEVDAGEVADDD